MALYLTPSQSVQTTCGERGQADQEFKVVLSYIIRSRSDPVSQERGAGRSRRRQDGRKRVRKEKRKRKAALGIQGIGTEFIFKTNSTT